LGKTLTNQSTIKSKVQWWNTKERKTTLEIHFSRTRENSDYYHLKGSSREFAQQGLVTVGVATIGVG
jgi:hypothetical protein